VKSIGGIRIRSVRLLLSVDQALREISISQWDLELLLNDAKDYGTF